MGDYWMAGRARPLSAACAAALVAALTPGSAAAEVDVLDYDLNLSVGADLNIVGAATLTVKATTATSAFSLDLAGFEVSDLRWEGAPIAVERGEDAVVITLPAPLAAGATGQVSLAWSGIPTPYTTPQGDLGILQDRGITYAINVTDGAHHWFPCIDRLDDKASVTLTLNVPRGAVSAGPGTLVERVATGPQTEAHTWRSDAELTPYLISFAYADRFETQTLSLDTEAGALPGAITLLPGTFDTAGHALEILPDLAAWLVERYGAFPAPKLGLHEIPFPGAVEQPGYIAMGSFYWAGDPRLDVYFAHELSHTWFQGKVTIRTWEDVWLSEGIAAWHELLWIERAQDLAAADAQAAIYIDAYRVGMASEGVFPIGDPAEVFGYTTYMKGPTVWRLLEHLAGREALQGVLRAYLSAPEGLGDLDAFFTHLGALGDPALSTFRAEWIDRAGLPSFRFGWAAAPSGEGEGLLLQLSQGAGALYTTPVDAHLTYADGRTEIVTLRPTEADHALLLCLSEAPLSVSLDPRRMIPRSPDQALTRLVADPADACISEPPTGCEGAQGLPALLSALLLTPLLPLLRRRRP